MYNIIHRAHTLRNILLFLLQIILYTPTLYIHTYVVSSRYFGLQLNIFRGRILRYGSSGSRFWFRGRQRVNLDLLL